MLSKNKGLKKSLKDTIFAILIIVFSFFVLKIYYTSTNIVLFVLALTPTTFIFSSYIHILIYKQLVKPIKKFKIIYCLFLISFYIYPILIIYFDKNIKEFSFIVKTILKYKQFSLKSLLLKILPFCVFFGTLFLSIITFFCMIFKYHIRYLIKEKSVFLKHKNLLISISILGLITYFFQITNPIIFRDDYRFGLSNFFQKQRYIYYTVSLSRWLISIWGIFSFAIPDNIKMIVIVFCLCASSYYTCLIWNIKNQFHIFLVSGLLINNVLLTVWFLWPNTEVIAMIVFLLAISMVKNIKKGIYEKILFVFYIIILNAAYQVLLVYLGIVLIIGYINKILKANYSFKAKKIKSLILKFILIFLGFVISLKINDFILSACKLHFALLEERNPVYGYKKIFKFFLYIFDEFTSRYLIFILPILVLAFFGIFKIFKQKKNRVQRLILFLVCLSICFLSIYSAVLIAGIDIASYVRFPIFVIDVFAFYVFLNTKKLKRIFEFLVLLLIFALSCQNIFYYKKIHLKYDATIENAKDITSKIIQNDIENKKVVFFTSKDNKLFSDIVDVLNYYKIGANYYDYDKLIVLKNINDLSEFLLKNKISYYKLKNIKEYPSKNFIKVIDNYIFVKVKHKTFFFY